MSEFEDLAAAQAAQVRIGPRGGTGAHCSLKQRHADPVRTHMRLERCRIGSRRSLSFRRTHVHEAFFSRLAQESESSLASWLVVAGRFRMSSVLQATMAAGAVQTDESNPTSPLSSDVSGSSDKTVVMSRRNVAATFLVPKLFI